MGFAQTSSKYVTFFSSTINLQKSDAIFTIGCSKDNNKEEITNLRNLLQKIIVCVMMKYVRKTRGVEKVYFGMNG